MTTEYEKELVDVTTIESSIAQAKKGILEALKIQSELKGYRKAREEIKEKLEILYLKTCELEELNPEEWNECETLSINSILKELGLSEEEKVEND